MTKKYSSEETIRAILDVSTQLFVEKGYEKTTIQDIVNGLEGLSRGAIYHHFQSKEEIIDAVVKRLTPNSKYLEAISSRQDLNGLEKIQQLLLETLFNPEMTNSFSLTYSLFDNPKFYLMYLKHTNEVLAPQIEAYLSEGNADGSLAVEYPQQISEIIVMLLGTWFSTSLYPNSIATFWEKLAAVKYLLEGINVAILSDDVMEKIKDEVTSKGIENEKQ